MQQLMTSRRPDLREGVGETEPTKSAYSDKSRHVTLTPQGPRGQRSPRSGQTPSLHYVVETRQHYQAVVVSTENHHPNMARQDICTTHPLWDGIHDSGLDLEAIQANAGLDLGAQDRGHQLHKQQDDQ
jgi:hypothetical protein